MATPDPTPSSPEPGRRTWTEEVEIAGGQLIARLKELIEEGNVRWLIIRHDGRTILQIPLTVVGAAGLATAVLAPWLAVLSGIAALFARVQISIIREGEPPT